LHPGYCGPSAPTELDDRVAAAYYKLESVSMRYKSSIHDLLDLMPKVKLEPPDPDPDCRWCGGTGKVALATTVQPCLDCLAPWKGWVWADEDREAPTVFYVDMDGREVEVNAVCDAETGELPDGAVCVGRLSRYSRPGRNRDRASVKTILEKSF